MAYLGLRDLQWGWEAWLIYFYFPTLLMAMPLISLGLKQEG